MYDLAIVGAGPAGSTLARLIGSTYRVLLVDKRPLHQPAHADQRGKCCGGLLAPDAQQVLGEMGLALPGSILLSPQLFVVRTLDLKTDLERYYQRFYLNMNREAFDRWLVSLMPPTVDFRPDTAVRNIQDATRSSGGRARGNPSGHLLTLRHLGREYTEQARFLIGADGANSLVRRALSLQPNPRRYVAVQEWFKVRRPLPYFTALFDPDITDFYAWTIPKEDHLILGAALPLTAPANVNRDPRGRLGSLKDKLTAKGFDFSRPVRRESCLLLRPLQPSDILPGEGPTALIGEAAGWISPSSAEGFSYAFRSAQALAEALSVDGLDGAVGGYRTRTRRLFANILVKSLKLPFMYQPHLRSLVLRTGVGSTRVRAPASSPDDWPRTWEGPPLDGPTAEAAGLGRALREWPCRDTDPGRSARGENQEGEKSG